MKRRTKGKHRRTNAWKQLVRCMDLPEFSAGTDECVEILGGNTVQIEGAKGIHTYEREVVKIHMNRYLLVINGSDFELLRFTDGTLRVIGNLNSICWEGI